MNKTPPPPPQDQPLPDQQEPMSFEKIEEIFQQRLNGIMMHPQLLPGAKFDMALQALAGTVQEMLTTLKSHHPGQPLIIPKKN